MKNALAYEWRRAASLRSTWTLLGTAVLVASFFSWVMYKTFDYTVMNGTTQPVPVTTLVNNINGPYLMVAIIIGVFAAMAWGHEYRYGVARLTFASFPRRYELFAAKTLIIVVFTTIAWFATLIASLFVINIFDRDNRVDFSFSQVLNTGAGSATGMGVSVQRLGSEIPSYTSHAWEALLRSLAYAVILALIVGALACLTRSLPISIVVALLLPLFVERLLLALAGVMRGNGLKWLNDVAPFDNGERFVAWSPGYDTTADGTVANLINPWQAGLVFAAWALLLTALAYIFVERRDA